jgi:hypothetical protein
MQGYPTARNSIDELKKIYSSYVGGNADKSLSDLVSFARSLGLENVIPGNAKTTAEKYDSVMKLVAQQITEQLRGMSKLAPQAEIGLLSKFAAEPKLDPTARQDLLNRAGAQLEMKKDMFNEYVKNGLPPVDAPHFSEHVNKFSNDRTISNYVKREAEKGPPAAGVTTPAAPPLGAPPSAEDKARAADELERRRKAAQATNAAEPWREPNAAFGAIP